MNSFFMELILALFNAVFNPVKPGQFVQEDMGLSIRELLYKNGYPFENHTVITEDGYILEIHRIPHGRNASNFERPAILVTHGLLASSITFLLAGPEKSLGYYLADKGYDVWLSNTRGNVYSRKHRSLHPDYNNAEFFDYTIHESGVYDLPAMVDYVASVTRQKKIFYLGHSHGCTAYYVMLSEKPEYNQKIRLMVALAPVVYTTFVKAPSFVLPAVLQDTFEKLITTYKAYELLPWNEFRGQLSNTLCRDNTRTQQLCVFMFYVNGGFNDKHLNTSLVPLLLSHMPSGASTRQLLHFTQWVNSNEFQRYDYGKEINLRKYGGENPPLYNLNNVKAPVAIYYGRNDWFTSYNDVQKLASSLPNLVLLREVPDKNFAHFNFILSLYVRELVYDEVLNVLNKF